jgi:hypothetical protein
VSDLFKDLYVEHIMANLSRNAAMLAEERRQKKYKKAAERAGILSADLKLVQEHLEALCK